MNGSNPARRCDRDSGRRGRAENSALPVFRDYSIPQLAQPTLVASKPYPRANHSQNRFASATVFAVPRTG